MRVRIKITVDPDRYKKLKQRFETVSVAFAASLFIVAAFAGLAGVFSRKPPGDFFKQVNNHPFRRARQKSGRQKSHVSLTFEWTYLI